MALQLTRMQAIALAVALAFVLSVGAAFGTALLTRTDAARAGGTPKIVSQLKQVNHKLHRANRKLRHAGIHLRDIKIVIGDANDHLENIDRNTAASPSGG